MSERYNPLSVEALRELIEDPRFVVLEFISANAIFASYKVSERGTPNIYTIKVLSEEFRHNTRFIELLEKNAHMLRDLQYPSIARFYKFAQEGNCDYILMDYTDSNTLTYLSNLAIERRRPLALIKVLNIISQVAKSIAYIHAEGYIHRDIKPDNIWLNEANERVLLTDLTLVIPAGEHDSLGKAGNPFYMPYEQHVGLEVDVTVDSYALAVLTYELLTGYRLFAPPSNIAFEEIRQYLIEAHHNQSVPLISEVNKSLPGELNSIFAKALAKDPKNRYQDILDFSEAIYEALLPQLFNPSQDFVYNNSGILGGLESSRSSLPSLPLKIFISYRKTDKKLVEILERELQQMKDYVHSIWIDTQLEADDLWWASILENIRISDVILTAVSNDYLDSEACRREYEYAIRLGKEVKLIKIADFDYHRLPELLAQKQQIDFTPKIANRVDILKRVLSKTEPSKPLPDSLPPEPEPPLSELVKLEKRATQVTLTREDEDALFAGLHRYIISAKADERASALKIVKNLQARKRDISGAFLEQLKDLEKQGNSKKGFWNILKR